MRTETAANSGRKENIPKRMACWTNPIHAQMLVSIAHTHPCAAVKLAFHFLLNFNIFLRTTYHSGTVLILIHSVQTFIPVGEASSPERTPPMSKSSHLYTLSRQLSSSSISHLYGAEKFSIRFTLYHALYSPWTPCESGPVTAVVVAVFPFELTFRMDLHLLLHLSFARSAQAGAKKVYFKAP